MNARPTRLPRSFSPLVAAALALASFETRAETVRLDAEKAAARIVDVSHAALASSERTAAAEAVVKGADAAALPSLSASASLAQRSSVPEFRLPIAPPGQEAPVLAPDITTTYGFSLKAQQALYAGGAIQAQREATRHDAAASSAARAQTLADLRLAAQVAYWEAVRAGATLEAARAAERRAQRLRVDSKALFEAGTAVRADVLAAEERVASAHVQVIRAETAAANALEQLRSLLQIASADTIELADSLAGPLPKSPEAADDLRRLALEKRPELAALSAQLAGARAREEAAKAPSKPSLGAVAQWDYNRPNQRYFPLTDEFKTSWSVGLFGSFTLFDGGKWRADVASSRAGQRALGQEREELVRRILLDVDTTRRELEAALAAVVSADAARAAADEREKAATERHEAGLAAMSEILDAESQLAAAEQQQVAARTGAWVAAATLERVVGR